MEKISLPKGTRDFGPEQMAKRQFIIDSIKKVFQRYGFQPLETPAMENLSTLQGKYGDEGDKLLFKILDSGDYFEEPKKLIEISPLEDNLINQTLRDFANTLQSNLNRQGIENTYKNYKAIENEVRLLATTFDFGQTEFSLTLKEFITENSSYFAREINIEPSKNNSEPFDLFIRQVINSNIVAKKIKNEFESKKLTSLISEKGLRYDLTVPFARYVVMNRHEIAFPFKRYQIQPVWRADRPQKGRYREFYQCDADVVGTDSLVCEAEIILMIKDAFKALGIVDYSIKINHRGILSGLAEILGASENENSLFVAIDKLDKIGDDKVKEELQAKGFNAATLPLLFEILSFEGSTAKKIELLSKKFESSSKGKKGIDDLGDVFSLLKRYGATDEHVEFDIALARGLSYYTGCIFEVKINNVVIGSVSGGGRYDNLTGVFDSKEKSSGVGISFGIDRLYDSMEELNIFPKETTAASTILITHLDREGFEYGLKTAQAFRERGIASEIYPDQVKIKKQMEYADRKKIPFVVVIGPEEVQTQTLTLKKMETGNQLKLSFEEIATAIQLFNKN